MNESGNATSAEKWGIVYRMFREDVWPVILMYVPVFLSAFSANIVVIFVVFKDEYMRNATNYFLVNLSVADLLVTLVCMPSAAWRAYTAMYPFGSFICTFSQYLQCISVATSIFTITAMAIDRYLAITRPFGLIYRCFNKTTTIIVIIALWLTSLILFSPILWLYKLKDVSPYPDGTVYMCVEDWSDFVIPRRTVGIVWFVFMFALPGVIMLFAYSMMGRTLCSVMPPSDNMESRCTQQRNKVMRIRKRVACILLCLTFVFAACWLPMHVILLRKDVIGDIGDNRTLRYLLLLGHANSALNPIIYCSLSRKFRNSIKSLFQFKIQCVRKSTRHPLDHWADSSASGTQLNRIKTATPAIQNPLHFTLSRLQSSQKTTKTCAV